MNSIFKNVLVVGLVAVGVGSASFLFSKPANAGVFFRAPFVRLGYGQVYEPYVAVVPSPAYRSYEVWVPGHFEPGHRNAFGEYIPRHYVPGHYA